MTREEKEHIGKYILEIAKLLEDGCYQQEILLGAAHIIDEALEHDKNEVIDKIKAEIEQTTSRYCISRERGCSGQVEWSDRLIKESEVLEIIEKYKSESEAENGSN